MKIVILDGHAVNPGDLSWDPLRNLGELEVFDRTAESEVVARAGDAEVLLTTRAPLTARLFSHKYIPRSSRGRRRSGRRTEKRPPGRCRP